MLRGLKPCVTGIVLATGCYMVLHNCVNAGANISVSVRAVILTVILFCTKYMYQYFKKKKMSPIVLIMISAVVGVVVCGIK